MRFGQNPLTKPKEYYWQAFGIAMLVAACFFVPYIILDQGYFLFYGDFNVQQVPFYKLAHEAIRSGNWYWISAPIWAPTLTGFMVLITMIVIVVIFIRILVWIFLRLSLLFI